MYDVSSDVCFLIICTDGMSVCMLLDHVMYGHGMSVCLWFNNHMI